MMRTSRQDGMQPSVHNTRFGAASRGHLDSPVAEQPGGYVRASTMVRCHIK